MKKSILALTILLAANAHAKKIDGVEYMEVKGAEVLKDHGINQYDDSNEPYQGYLVTLPQGYLLRSVDVQGNGNTICGVTAYDYKTQTVRIDGLSLETDEQGCDITLTIFEKATKKDLKATYSIEQVGT